MYGPSPPPKHSIAITPIYHRTTEIHTRDGIRGDMMVIVLLGNKVEEEEEEDDDKEVVVDCGRDAGIPVMTTPSWTGGGEDEDDVWFKAV